MNNELIIYTIISFLLLFLFAKISYKLKLVDLPIKRKIHTKVVVYTGGITISFILVISILLLNVSENNLNSILAVAFLISIIGLIDDKYNLSAGNKLSLQIIPIFYLIILENLTLNHLGDYNNFKPFTVFVIRHGNSLHNQPLNQHVLDSSLTPLGIYQASKLGESLNSKYGAKFKGNVLLCSSFLQRTQLTGLCILQKILDVDDKGWSIGPDIATTLNKGYQSLLTIAITRYNKYRNQQKGLCVFKGFDPLKGDSNYDDFITFYGTLPDVNPLNECTLPVKKGWFSGGKNRQMYKKTRKARLNGIRIKGKSIKGKSIKGKSIKGKSTRRSNGSKRHTRKRSHA